MKFIASLICCLLPLGLNAQFQFKNDVPVRVNGMELSRAWEGGLNSAQFQTMDLNGDGNQDLVIFNRIARQINTYLNINDSYVSSPEYAYDFPSDVVNWMVLIDYNCDGKKDLFTSTSLGIRVYENTTSGDSPTWSIAAGFLTIDGGTNIQVSPADIPGFADVNGDGALDILTYRFGSSTTIDYYQNTGTCGSLGFTRLEREWGGIRECDCDEFSFGAPCPGGEALAPNDANDVQHAGGKTILPFDADNDGDIDIITSDEFCETLYFMENEGDNVNALMTSVVDYPAGNPAAFPIFPSAFMEDIDFDGLQELIISSNADENIGNLIDLSNNVRVYENAGSSDVPDFNQASSPFFQSDMLDLGENAHLTFADSDNDGDLDMFAGNRGLPGTGGFGASIFHFENTGNSFSPSFELTNNDFLSLRSQNMTSIKPQFIDTDNDDDLDLIYQATVAFGDTRIFYHENTGNFSFSNATELNIDNSFADTPFFYDINGDRQPDVLVGNQFGSLSLYINQGNLNFGAEETEFGGLENDFNRINLSVLVVDFDRDGVEELLTIDSSGELLIYDRGVNTSFNAIEPETEVLEIGTETFPTNFGLQSALAAADIDGDGLPEIFVGSIKGGVHLLESTAGDGNNSGNLEVRLAPNPTSGRVTVLANSNATISIFNLSGQKIFENIQVESSTPKELLLTNIPAGLYILRAVNDNNQSTIKKILVQK